MHRFRGDRGTKGRLIFDPETSMKPVPVAWASPTNPNQKRMGQTTVWLMRHKILLKNTQMLPPQAASDLVAEQRIDQAQAGALQPSQGFRPQQLLFPDLRSPVPQLNPEMRAANVVCSFKNPKQGRMPGHCHALWPASWRRCL